MRREAADHGTKTLCITANRCQKRNTAAYTQHLNNKLSNYNVLLVEI